MHTYIALLRGINVSGQKKIKMAELKQYLNESGFCSVQTYIQSGNLVFRHTESSHRVVEEIIRAEVLKRFNFDIGVWVRSYPDFLRIVVKNPFSSEAYEDDAGLYFVFLNQKPSPGLSWELQSEHFPNESFKITDECIFLYCHAGYGKAKCNNNFFERRLKVQATTRNLRTVKKLSKMSAELDN